MIQTFYNLLNYYLKRSIALDMFQPVAADLIILTIGTLQVAMIKKNVANASLTTNHGLFAVVDADGGDIKTSIASAPAGSFCRPIHIALARAQRAVAIGF
jgi:hypothetical protein